MLVPRRCLVDSPGRQGDTGARERGEPRGPHAAPLAPSGGQQRLSQEGSRGYKGNRGSQAATDTDFLIGSESSAGLRVPSAEF